MSENKSGLISKDISKLLNLLDLSIYPSVYYLAVPICRYLSTYRLLPMPLKYKRSKNCQNTVIHCNRGVRALQLLIYLQNNICISFICKPFWMDKYDISNARVGG